MEGRSVLPAAHVSREPAAYLEPLILKDSLDGSILAAGSHLGLKHHTERSVANNLALCVGDLLGFARQAILNLFADDLYIDRKTCPVSGNGRN